MNIKLTVKGTHCKSCGMLIQEALEEKGATDIKVVVDEKKQTATVECTYAGKKEDIVAVVQEQGYKVTS